MKRVFNAIIDRLCEETGYDYDFLVEKFMDAMDDNDIEQFIEITMERDW